MAGMRRRKHRLVVDVTFTSPVEERTAWTRLSWLLREEPGHAEIVKTDVKRFGRVLASKQVKERTTARDPEKLLK